MHTSTITPSHAPLRLTGRWLGTLGSASDRDVDAHLLVCDDCLADLIRHALEALSASAEPVPA